MGTNYIFVYGTLKRGGVNNSLLHGCEFVGSGRVWGCALLDFGGYPGMIPTNVRGGNISSVQGDVYAVPDGSWPRVRTKLDRLEKSHRLFLRVKIEVDVKGVTRECVAYLFMVTVDPENVIQGGVWPVPVV